MSEKNIERKIGEAGSKAREVDQNRVEREREWSNNENQKNKIKMKLEWWGDESNKDAQSNPTWESNDKSPKVEIYMVMDSPLYGIWGSRSLVLGT